MIKRKSGFTLMEIMVVIIVIAVLASVAGPMIGSITDQGRASATKSKMSSLKSALLAYQGDVGRFPYKGKAVNYAQNYNANDILSSNDETKNVLVTNNNILCGGIKNYQKKWKGPYMDSDVSDFMVDSWGQPIQYVAYNKNLYLWSYGPDMVAGDGSTFQGTSANLDNLAKQLTENPDAFDDIILSVTRFKKSAGTTFSIVTTTND